MPNKNDSKEPLYRFENLIETISLRRGLRKVKTKEIKQLGLKFYNTLNLVTDLFMLPHVLLTLEHAKRLLVPYEIMAGLKTRLEIKANKISQDEADEHFHRVRKEIFDAEVLPKQNEQFDKAMTGGEKTLLEMLQDNRMGFRETYEALLYSCVVWIWCNFEVLMKELWELALNMGGGYTSKNVIKNLSDESEGFVKVLQGINISLDYLARYNFDLSNKLGSALLYKFDFTSHNGIREAYNQAFPKSVSIKEALDNETIKELEATRNVIVHNAGIIDEDFCIKTNTSKAEIDNKSALTSYDISRYGKSTIDAGLRVMAGVSSIVSYAKSLKRK